MKLSIILALATGVTVVARHTDVKLRSAHDDPNLPHLDDPKFIGEAMDAHWYWRKIHCAQDLTWDPKLAQAAADSVNACTKNLQHDRGGSNLSGVGPVPFDYQNWLNFTREAIHGWHEEEPKYPYGPNPGWNAAFGHFTQMVWRDSSRIGCALANCDGTGASFPGRIYCFYETAGNNIAEGEFEQNVWPPVCRDPNREEAEAHYHSGQ